MPAYVTRTASGKLASYDAETMVAMFVDADGKAAIESAALANGTADITYLSELTTFELARTTFTAEADLTLGKIDVAADEDPTADTDGETVAGIVIALDAGSDAARTVVACHTFTARAGNASDAVAFSNESGFASWEPAPGAIVRGIGTVRPDAEGIIDDEELAALLEPFIDGGGGGGGTITASLLVADADLSGGSFTSVDFVKPDGSVVGAGVPRAVIVGGDVAVLSGDDGGKVYTVTASGACTLVKACQAGDLVSVYAGVQQYVVQATNEGGGPGVALPGAADRFVPLSQDSIDGLEALAADVDAIFATPDGVPVGHVLADSAPYLKVGHDGLTVNHEEGAFECDTDLDFATGLDVRAWFRTVSMPAGANTFAELVTQNVDAGVGAVDAYELAFHIDGDGDPRPYAEHIRTGETVEDGNIQGPKHSVGYGAVYGVRHTIDYTGGPAGVGVEKFWMAAGNDPDVVTADGIGWKLLATQNSDVAESVKTSYTEPFWIGASQHETHVYIVQMFDGIDGTCLVDLHASDATSSTTVTCREGTVWTAAGTQGEIVNLPSGGSGGDITTDTAWTAKGDLIVATANNAASVLTVGANDTILMAASGETTGTKWANASTARTALSVGGIVTGQDEGATVSATTTETTLLDSTPTVTAAAGEALRITMGGTCVQNSGGSASPTLRLKLGGSTVLSFSASLANSATTRPWEATATIRVQANGDANASGTCIMLAAVFDTDVGTHAGDLSAGQALDVTWQHPSATNCSAEIAYLLVERVRSA